MFGVSVFLTKQADDIYDEGTLFQSTVIPTKLFQDASSKTEAYCTNEDMPVEIVLLLNEHLVDIIASRIRATGIDVTVAPPNGIRVPTEFNEAEDVQYLPGLKFMSQAKVLSALL